MCGERFLNKWEPKTSPKQGALDPQHLHLTYWTKPMIGVRSGCGRTHSHCSSLEKWRNKKLREENWFFSSVLFTTLVIMQADHPLIFWSHLWSVIRLGPQHRALAMTSRSCINPINAFGWSVCRACGKSWDGGEGGASFCSRAHVW